MKNQSICRRCHRIRAVDGTRCCATCAVKLRAMERRRAPPKACELCIDPIDAPHVDADGTRRWRACPNPATRQVLDNGGRTLDVCEEHFAKGAS
jgi:hypothetical protein